MHRDEPTRPLTSAQQQCTISAARALAILTVPRSQALGLGERFGGGEMSPRGGVGDPPFASSQKEGALKKGFRAFQVSPAV